MLALGLGERAKDPKQVPHRRGRVRRAGVGALGCRVAVWGRWRGNFAFLQQLPAATQRLLPLPHEQMEKALANLASRTTEAGAGEPVVSKAPSSASTSSALKGVSQALLERVSNSVLALALVPGRGEDTQDTCLCLTPSPPLPKIRAKEAQKLQALMTRDPRQELRLAMLGRLPAMARVLRNIFVAEKKQALTMEVVCARMADSYDTQMPPGRKGLGWGSPCWCGRKELSSDPAAAAASFCR